LIVGQLQLFQVNIYTCCHLKTGHKTERRWEPRNIQNTTSWIHIKR